MTWLVVGKALGKQFNQRSFEQDEARKAKELADASSTAEGEPEEATAKEETIAS